MRILLFVVFTFCCCCAFSQAGQYNFRRLTTNDGLSDGIVHAFVQDKYGFIWIGTTYGLNRFDGVEVKSFFSNSHDSNSVTDNFIQSLYCDTKKNLWIGTEHGLCRYDYTTNKFVRYTSPSLIIHDFKEDDNRLWLATSNGLWIVDEEKKRLQRFDPGPALASHFQCYVFQIRTKDNNWYLATNRGIKIFNPHTKFYSEITHDSSQRISIASNYVLSLSMDFNGNLWVISRSHTTQLERIDFKKGSVKLYNHFFDSKKNWKDNNVNKIITDKKGTVWVTSFLSGVSKYDAAKDDFIDYETDPFRQNSLVANSNDCIYQDNDGTIWIGSAGYGCSYFNPYKNLFSTIYPADKTSNRLTDLWCRAACEDREGHLWLATGNGVFIYDSLWQTFKILVNTAGKRPSLYYNSVRSMLQDHKGDIWIGTSKGLNRFHPSTGVMDFFGEKQGIPLGFFWMIAEDKQGTVWLGSREGLFRYDRNKNTFDDLSHDTLFAKYARRNVQAVYADSHNRLWIGLLEIGLIMYDSNQKNLKLLTVRDSLISDTRFSSFAEDKNGCIWIGSEQGLTQYNPAKNCSVFFTRENGLPSDRTNNIMVDSFNRIWVGTSNGLCTISADRKKIKTFNANDGMLSSQFNEQSAYQSHNGTFIYPTYKGSLAFRPEDYRQDKSSAPVYITSLNILNKEIINNPEDLSEIHLKYNQNFFSITLTGLNYMNPGECIFAYKLEPFDKDWIITQKREQNYTNVPAGNYAFRYKLINSEGQNAATEKILHLSISEIFYRTWWFKILALSFCITAIILFFRYRYYQKEKIVVLQNKAYSLEKEKTLVQYENLKQQLNPHFLFNSLTSLRSLIRVDPSTATQFLDGLSKTYRYLLRSGDKELVTLQEELDFVQTFVRLQQTRFKDGLEISLKVNEELFSKYIVPATLQNLIENAIKHNTASDESPLVIKIYNEDGYIVVKNNLQRYRIVETSNKRGLSGLCSLYKYLTDKPVIISADENNFIVKIPLI